MRLPVRVTPSLIVAIINSTIPGGWKVKYTRDRGGATERSKRTIFIPRLKHNYRTLWVYLHELGHVRRMLEDKFVAAARGQRLKGKLGTSYEEFCAEEYAMDALVHFGFPILPGELADARTNVRQYVKHERALGLPIYGAVERFVRAI